MSRKHYVLTELEEYGHYPVLMPIKHYCNEVGNEQPTSNQLADKLEKEKFEKIETDHNIILTNLGKLQ